jgi:hypothetical protein
MKHKILVITSGTIAAGVGQEFLKQLRMHPASQLQAIVRYIDTANLLTRYSNLRNGEWFQMTINPQFMDTIRRNPQNYQDFNELLYPGFLPEIQGSGGGSIRYNAAGAIIINRARMKEWLTSSITDLVRADSGQVDLSVALIVSAVGATGSGSLERLIDLVVDCAQTASIPAPLHCDVFILEPGMQGVTDLGLSNTLALYAEMAATRLSHNDGGAKSYRGRTIVVGWGSERYMSSIEQLKEATATLVRLTHDPSTAIAAEFQEREVDNHVLREQDWQTQIPSHLSSATAVTISLGDLEEKIVQRDAVRLLDTLVFGEKAPESFGGEYLFAGQSDYQAGPLANTLANFLQGSLPEDRYGHLIGRLTEVLSLSSLQITTAQMQSMTTQQQAGRLRGAWLNDKEEILKSGRMKIRAQGATLATVTLNDILISRRRAMATELSLRDLHAEYLFMDNIITSTLNTQQGFILENIDDREVTRRINALERANWGKDRALQQALAAVQGNLEALLQREAHSAALEVLKILQNHCSEASRNLEIVLNKLLRQRRNNPKWAGSDQKFHVDMHHLLHMAALSSDAEITRYADRVSIFASAQRRRASAGEGAGAIGKMVAGEQQEDQVAAFRKWLDDQDKLDALFVGETDTILDLAEKYARDYVHNEIIQHSVLDILLQTGEDVLSQRLSEAAAKAHSLIPYSPQFASEHREARHVCARWKSEEQRGVLQRTIDQAFGQGQCTLLQSEDPSEIVVFYYVDGLPMSAINDLTGRCLEAFLKRRKAWHRQTILNGGNANGSYKQRIGVPVYSGKDAEERVLDSGVVYQLYNVRGQNVGVYTPNDIPELAPSGQQQQNAEN